jgi:PHD/YefM family antitoxin component YafN of YafNO toxin-antitoxin module
MKLINVTELRKNIYNIVDQISEKNKPLFISGKRNNAVLISESDWNSLNETYLFNVKQRFERIYYQWVTKADQGHALFEGTEWPSLYRPSFCCTFLALELLQNLLLLVIWASSRYSNPHVHKVRSGSIK